VVSARKTEASPTASVAAASSRRTFVIRAGLALLLGFALWWGFHETKTPVPPEPMPAIEPTRSPSPTPARAAVTASPVPTPAPSAAPQDAGLRSPDPVDDSDAELRPSHPITPAHERIYRENNMIGAMNAAMDLGNIEELRRLNREYRREYPEDSHLMQEGYDIIADCMERRTAANRVAAQRFYDTQIASMLRRYIRIHCLQ
jgi:hypothetical protein